MTFLYCYRFKAQWVVILSICIFITEAFHITLPPIQRSQVEEFLEQAGQKMDEMYNEFDRNIELRGN